VSAWAATVAVLVCVNTTSGRGFLSVMGIIQEASNYFSFGFQSFNSVIQPQDVLVDIREVVRVRPRGGVPKAAMI